MNTFLLEIVTPERVVFSQQVDNVIVRGTEGEFGVMAGHLPLVTPIKIAPITVKSGSNRTEIAVNGGFIEVQKEKAIILAESAELPQDIDLDRANAAKERAELRLSSGGKDQIDEARAQVALQRAITRINVASTRK